MPLALSWSRYQPALSCHIFQPRVSAVAAAFRMASCVGLSSASNAALLTKVTSFGIQACVS